MTKKLLTFLTLLTLFFGVGWAETKTITITAASFGSPTTYSVKTANVDGYSFTANKIITGTQSPNVGSIQMRNSQGGGLLYNTTPIPNLKSITVNVSGGSNNYVVTTGTSEQPTDNENSKNSTGTFNAITGDTYFQLDVTANTCYFSSIVITYETGDTPQPTTYGITIGNMSNGSVTATPNSNIAAGTEVSLTVEPDPGYELDELIVTGNTSGNNVTVANNKFTMPSEDVTVNATFTESSSGGNAGPMIYTPSSSNSGTLTGAPTSSVTASIAGFSGFTTGQGAQRTAANDPATITFSNLPTNYKVTKIEVEYCTNKSAGVGTISATLNGNAIGDSFDASYVSGDGRDLKTATLYNNAAGTVFNGSLVVSTHVTTNSIYIYKVLVYYEEEVAGAYSIETVCTPTVGGSINCSKSSSNGNEEITFTVSTNDNYEFEYVEVKDADDNAVEISVSNGTYSFTMPTKDVTITAHFNVAGSLYILGQVNGNDAVSWDSHKGVKMNYSNGVYTANVFVSAADGGGYFAFRTVLANWGSGYDGSRWGSESGNWLFSEDQPNGNATLVNGSDKSFRLPNGIYQFIVNINDRTLVVTKVENATVTISPNGGDVKKGSTATITESGLSTFLSSCQPVINSSNQTVTSGITVPSVKIYYSTDGNNFTEGDTYTFEQSQEVALTGKAAIVATTVTNNNTIELAQATKQATFRVKYGIAVAEGLSGGNIGNISPSSKLAYEDDEVSFKVNPNGGYQIASVTVTTDGGQTVTTTAGENNTYTFTMPADHVTLSAAFTAVVYNITLNNDNTKGTASLSATTATAGTEITVTVAPKAGYSVASVTATKDGGGTINVTDNQNGTYTFGMQSDNVVVVVNYSEVSSEPSDLFHESFGNASSAREWDDSYSVKTGVAEVYSGITGYTVTGAKQSKNTTGYIESGLMQSAGGTEASIIMGPLNVENYKDLVLSYYWKAASTSGSYSTSLYYATSANGSYSTVSGTGNGASSYVKRTYNLPEAAQVSTLYLKIVFNTSNTNAFIDEVNLAGVPNSITPSLQAPVITPEGGVFLNSEYPDGMTVTIAPVTDGSTVYYTTDGTEPSAANGTEITASTTITVTTTTTVQAIAIMGEESSEVVSETYQFTDKLIADVEFSPIPGTYSGAQTLQMYSTAQNAKIYYIISEDAMPATVDNTTGSLYSNTDVINLLPGHTYQVKAIAYVGNNCSEIASGTYVINTASSSALNSIAELNAASTGSTKKTMNNPIQVIYMNTWRHKNGTNNTSTIPEYAYIRDNTGYSMVYFGNGWYNTWDDAVDNPKICQMGDWIPGGVVKGAVQVWSDGFHNELGGKNNANTVTGWPTATDELTNTPIIPEEMTNTNINAGWSAPASFATTFNEAVAEYVANNNLSDNPDDWTSAQESAVHAYAAAAATNNEGYIKYVQDGNVWGHYVHLRKNTIRVTNGPNANDATDGELGESGTRKKYSGFITDQSGDELTYYDAFYNFSGFNGTPNYSNDFFQNIQNNGGTFDVYGIVGFYGPKAADAESNYTPFEVFPIDFLYIYKPIIHMGGNDYNDADPVTTLESQTVTITCATEGATIYYKTSDMEDYAVYTPGTEITVDATTTIETYSSIPTQYNDVMESVVNSLTINIGSIEAPVITEPSVVKTVGESVTTTITCVTDGATIYYTTDGSDPKTSGTRQVYSSALTFEETTTVRAIAYKVVEGTGYYSAEAEPRTYTFVKSNGIVYDLVTDQTQLNESSVFIVVNKANHMAMGNTQDANHRDAAGVKFVDEETKVQVYGNDDVAQFTLKKVGNNWYMQTTNSNVNGYLYVSDGNMLLTEATADANAEATINIDADAEHQAHISFVYNHETTRYLRYWNGGQAFNTYTSETSNLPVSLYYVVATPLANIEKEGVKGQQYTIADQLIAVHYKDAQNDAGEHYLWCKDQGNVSISKTEKTGDDQIDYLKDVTKVQKGDWDQSNWVVLKFTNPTNVETISGAVGKYINPASITGHYTDGVNFTITLPDGADLVGKVGDKADFTPNVYCPVNYLDANLNLNGGEGPVGVETGEHYFFMNPKIQEVATVTYAVWNGTCFVIPAKAGGNNQGNFDGAFSVAWTYNAYGDQKDNLQANTAYRFLAVLNTGDAKLNSYANTGAKAGENAAGTVIGKEVDPQAGKVVYALDLNGGTGSDNIITAIQDVADGTGKAVAGVKYYNLAGIESDRPFEGVNIVVTTYSDGSRSSSKVLK